MSRPTATESPAAVAFTSLISSTSAASRGGCGFPSPVIRRQHQGMSRHGLDDGGSRDLRMGACGFIVSRAAAAHLKPYVDALH